MHEYYCETKRYPFTAFGVVESSSKKMNMVGIGAIIHPYLIITLAQHIAE